MRQLLLAVPLLALLGAGQPTGQDPVAPADPEPVWVNLKSGVYHCPGTEHYGTTSNGVFLAESTAVARGYKANGGRRCGPLSSAPASAMQVPTLLPDSSPRPPAEGLSECVVVTLRDGDTIVCKVQGSVRLIGIDTPERDQQPFGTAATAGMAALIPAGATVQISMDKTARDRFGRLLGYAWCDGASVNWLMIRLGWAVSVKYPPNTRYAEWFDRAEARAKGEQRGLWRVGGFSCRPSRHRAGQC